MIKKVILFCLVLIIISGCSKIILKNRVIEKAPFKLEAGTYTIKAEKIDYPEGVFEKAKFWDDFYIFMTKVLVADKKLTLLLNEKFYKDYPVILNGELSESENLFQKVSSSLEAQEKEEIKKLAGKDISEKKKYTTQDYLNMQVEIVIKILEDKDEVFEKDKIYTELEKEDIINKIKQKRKLISRIAGKAKISFIVEVEEPYKEIFEKKKSYYRKDILFYKKTSFSERVENYTYPVWIKNIELSDLEKIYSGELKLKNKAVIIVNEKRKGYSYSSGNYIFWNGGNEEKATFEEYKIYLEKEESSLEKALEKNEKYNFSDVIGG